MSPELRKSVARCQAIVNGEYHETFPSALPVTRMDLGRVLEYVGLLERREATPPPRPTVASEATQKARTRVSAAESKLAWMIKAVVFSQMQAAQMRRSTELAMSQAATARGQAAAADKRRKAVQHQLSQACQELAEARAFIAEMNRAAR